MSFPPGENSSYQGYQQATAPQGYGGGFTAPEQTHQNAQTIYGQGQTSGAWHHGAFDEATEYASRETGNDKSVFSSLLSSVLSEQQQHEQAQPHEIEQAKAAHQKLYGGGSGQGSHHVQDDDIASAAAMQAVERSGSESGGLQSVIGMAMSEVTKLMGNKSSGSAGGYGGGQQGGASGSQSDMIKKAVSMAIKLYTSKQAGSAAGQAAGSGNPLGSVMSMLMGGGSQPSSSQSGGYSQPPTHQSNSSGYASPPSYQGDSSSYSNQPQNQGYVGHQQPGYGHQQQQPPYGQQQGSYGQAPPYEQQQQQQQQSGSGIEAVAANLLNKFLH